MADPPRAVPLRAHILDREYPLRVRLGDEAFMLRLADFVDKRLRAFRQQLPGQPDLTHAVLLALALAEEVETAHAELARLRAQLDADAEALANRLADALAAPSANLQAPEPEP